MDCGLEGITFTQVTLTKPQFASECDISNIINKFMRTGQLPVMNERPTIQSTEGLPDNFQDLMDSMVKVRQQFDTLPLEERNKFNNNPELWLEALANEKNVNEPEKIEEALASSTQEEGVREEAPQDHEAS